MDPKYLQAHDLIVRARKALRRGDGESARGMGEQAALLAPDLEDAWLILAASDPEPREALAYARKALELKPDSKRAHRAVEWATGKTKQAPAGRDASPSTAGIQKDAVTAFPRLIPQIAGPGPKSKPKKHKWIFAAGLGLLVCAVFAVAAWSAFSSPVFASIINPEPAPAQEDLWALVDVPKPSVTPIDASVFAATQFTETPTPEPTDIPLTATPTVAPATSPVDMPTSLPTDAPAPTSEATETPGVMTMEIVTDANNLFLPPNPSAPKPRVASKGDTRWIDVDLTNQRIYAYEGGTLVNWFLVSTGTWLTPTVTGEYRIYVKYLKANMHGPGYFLPDVPYVMYFHQSYGLHGTYWHNNFGAPMSHGCINLKTEDAAWLYDWSSIGTVVNVHY